MRIHLTLAAAAIALAPAAAFAQDSAGDTDSRSFAVVGSVPALCSGGTIGDGGGTFDLGVLIDTTTGLLRDDLAAPAQTLSGAYCSARSTITVDATAMTAQNYLATPPPGFSRSVDYVATAANWAPTPATFDTAAAANPNAVQVRDSAFSGDIAVSVDGFATTGGDSLRLVADADYRGTVTVTLAAAD